MRKRLLFVDDDELILNGLRRSLHSMRQEWEMQFVDTPQGALQCLDKEVYDAVISDMRMPLMDGAELLEEIKQRHPDVIRFILSGQSSVSAVLRSLSPAHQFLSKPCEPQELIERLEQAFATRDLLSNPSLKTVISGLRSIPSLPAIYDELTSVLRSEDVSVVQIERIISKDVSMATKILQLANSAFIGASGRVSSLLRALSLIGLETVRTLVLSVHVFSHFDKNSEVSAYLPAIWDHSVATADFARKIATHQGSAKSLVEESFTAGLVHDVGKVVLLAEMPRPYRQILHNQSKPLLALELESLGCTHAQVGACLLSTWGLPMSLVRAVGFHHCPMESGETQFSSLTAVHAADALAASNDLSPLNRESKLDSNYLELLGLWAHVEEWRSLACPNSSPPAATNPLQPSA
jgi:HD-like signal output (HDOD) protein/CheY-like chemotaxis protein